MGLLGRLGNIGRAVGVALTEEIGEALYKAGKPGQYQEGNETAPGGGNQDSAENAPAPTVKAVEDPKSMFWDPFAVIEQLGFKERPSQISYGTLKSIVYRMPVVSAVIQTRINQVAAFTVPQRDRYQIGYQLKLRDQDKAPKGPDKKFSSQMETMLQRTGVTDNPRGRADFETFIRKITWDA